MIEKRATSDRRATKGYFVDFIDPLFAVVLHIGFTHSVMVEPWYKDSAKLFSAETIFEVLTLFLGFLVVVQSWVGYHESIKHKPIKSPARFHIDIWLLTTYLLLILKFKSFGVALALLVVIFALFVWWDKFKAREYSEDSKGIQSRQVTVFWLSVFVLVFAVYLAVDGFVPESIRFLKWAFLIAAFGANLIYRGHKRGLWWPTLLAKIPAP